MFGLFDLDRALYCTREGQRIEAVPLDERLQLPPGKNSYLLQDWDQALAVEMPYDTVSASLARILGFTQLGCSPFCVRPGITALTIYYAHFTGKASQSHRH